MDDLAAKLSSLPKCPVTCQGGMFTWPMTFRDEDGQPFQPHFPLWADAETGAVHPGEPLQPGDEPWPAVLQTLVGFVAELLDDRACPERIEVRDAELAQYLRFHLAQTGIEVAESEHLPKADQAVAELGRFVAAQFQGPPSLLEARGVTIERVRAFAEAAAAFYAAAPWRLLSDADLVHIESPKPLRGMACFTVLGAGRNTYGLGIFSGLRTFERFVRAGQTGELDERLLDGLMHFLFDELCELPPADAALWDEHQLPVAGRRAYPFVVKYQSQGNVARPTAKELTHLEAVLRAFASTTEAEVDSGRWRKEVVACDGPMTITFAIPDLLDPPSAADWLKRGFAPDRRAHERIFTDLGRYLADHPPENEAAMASIMQMFSGRSLDDPLTQPQTPAEQAQDICYQAFEVHGRRRILLAREALRIDPDCADAHVVLAEKSPSLEEAADHYQQAVEAAERKLGPDALANDAGHFWGIAETRPYMRARFGLAESLAELGRHDEAIEHFAELLRLNPGDNQGVRYLLLPKLLACDRDQDAARLLKRFDEDSAVWTYARALLAFRLSGHSPAADRELRTAFRTNPHVPDLIDSDEPIPLPPHYAPGSFEEACVAATELRAAFRAKSGALDWLRAGLEARQLEADRVQREKRRKFRAKGKQRKK